MNDPIVEEVREARRKHAEKFNFNLHAICKDLKKIEKKCGHKVINFPPKLLKSTRIQTDYYLSVNLPINKNTSQPDKI